MTRLQSPPPTRHEIAGSIAAMIRSVNERADLCNRRWGYNRLPHLVPLDWLEKFRVQKHKWETACFECAGSPKPEDIAVVRKHGDAMLRAYDKLEDLAYASNHDPVEVGTWEFELTDGTPVILVRSRAEIGQIKPDGRTVQVWSLEEVVDIIEKFPTIARAKEAFPGAEVIQIKTRKFVGDALDDSLADLPF
jgi:hypothetical protein